eukprot:CAMPEP_0178894468 /NCGR_PEP_ID=MMETSP0786-20121207/26_1 /TAXON_ID=186022 /ORGANISM="Thalassionema frauenfeldii, Strain CCMP 1798" /LENGTH=197 /DNA_ID=CAMNT_0020564547 /DNA_START=689 /DNA_END=1282 /DNA_ORIENTATION=-
MVSQADQTLLLYYLEERLAFNEKDVAKMFVMMGVLGILVQGVLIKPFIACLGERFVIVFAFLLGSVHNVLYGIASKKWVVFVAISLASFVGMSFPTISAIKANNVLENEQGRIQGALFSIQALAGGTGPMVLRFVYRCTKDSTFPGPGTMWLVAAVLYFVATCFALLLPSEKANSKEARRDGYEELGNDYDSNQESL